MDCSTLCGILMTANHYKCGCITGLFDGSPEVFEACGKSNCERLLELIKETQEELDERKAKGK